MYSGILALVFGILYTILLLKNAFQKTFLISVFFQAFKIKGIA